MRTIFIFLVMVFWLVSTLAIASQKNRKKNTDAAGSGTVTKRTVPVRDIQSKRRAQMQRVEQWRRANEQRENAERWRRAKEKQDDVEQVHSIKMDSCEERLESLKTLYQAGILDQQEYDQRVERVKKKHMRDGETT